MKQTETGPVEPGKRDRYNKIIKEMLRNISGIARRPGLRRGIKGEACKKDEEEADHE